MRTLIVLLLHLALFACNRAGSIKLGGNSVPKSQCKGYLDSHLNKFVYTLPDELPEYPTGDTGFLRAFITEFNLPAENVQWTVVLEFVVDTTGIIISKGVFKKDVVDYTTFEIEALRVLGEIGDWIPGRCNGVKVVSKVYRPIKF